MQLGPSSRLFRPPKRKRKTEQRKSEPKITCKNAVSLSSRFKTCCFAPNNKKKTKMRTQVCTQKCRFIEFEVQSSICSKTINVVSSSSRFKPVFVQKRKCGHKVTRRNVVSSSSRFKPVFVQKRRCGPKVTRRNVVSSSSRFKTVFVQQGSNKCYLSKKEHAKENKQTCICSTVFRRSLRYTEEESPSKLGIADPDPWRLQGKAISSSSSRIMITITLLLLACREETFLCYQST